MATLLNINRILTNRDGAVMDTVERLESTDSAMSVNINTQNIPTDISRRANLVTDLNNATTSGAATINVDRLNPAVVNTTNVLTSLNAITGQTIADNLLSSTGNEGIVRRADFSGNGVNVANDGTITIEPFNLSSVTTFNTISARNTSLGPNNTGGTADVNLWHRGDLAVVLGDVNLGSPVTLVQGATTSDWTFSFAVAPSPALAVGTVIRLEGATPNAFNVDYTVVSGSGISYQTTTQEPVVGSFTGGTGIAFHEDPDSTTRGTYIYTSADQTTAATTTNTDWTILASPTDQSIDARQIRTGIISAARLPATLANADRLITVGTAASTVATNVRINTTDSSLEFRDADGNVILDYNEANVVPEYWLTPITGTLVAPTNNMYTLRLSTGTSTSGQIIRETGVVSSTRRTFPTDIRRIQVFINGLKLSIREFSLVSTDAENPSDQINFMSPLIPGTTNRVLLDTNLANTTIEVIIF